MTYINYPKYPLVNACHRCHCGMADGLYTGQTLVGDTSNFPNTSTFSTGGTGKLTVCLKCPECGHSITKGKVE